MACCIGVLLNICHSKAMRSMVQPLIEWKAQLERVSGGPLTEVHSVYGFGPATYLALPSGKAIGFIFSMSHSYCDTCNRVRLTSDGQMRLCLLRDDEADLVSLVRNGATEEDLACILNVHCSESKNVMMA